jgi:hypothetical protein
VHELGSGDSFDKLREIACEAWGVAPWIFDAACARGDVRFNHVMLAYKSRLVQSLNPAPLLEFVYPGTLEALDQQQIDERNKTTAMRLMAKAEREANGT